MSIFLCFSFLLLPFAGCSDSDNGTGESSGGDGVSLEDIRVIPLPQFISYGRGAFAVDKDVTISCTAAIEDEATLLAGYLKEPVGMFQVIGDSYESAAKYGLRSVILTIADMILLLSANLGVMNLLPIPALDGGRLVFLIVEALRGKPVPRDKEGFVHMIGFVILMGIMVLVMFNDFARIFGF